MRMPMPAAGDFAPADGQPGPGAGRLARLRARARRAPAVARQHWLFTLLLAFFFAKVEVHIEGPGGWAANLPTWRIEQHVLLDLFWGGRAMTGWRSR